MKHGATSDSPTEWLQRDSEAHRSYTAISDRKLSTHHLLMNSLICRLTSKITVEASRRKANSGRCLVTGWQNHAVYGGR